MTDATRHRIADADVVSEPGSRLLAEVEGVEIGVFNVGGELHAIANFCPHQGGPLCEGPTDGRVFVDDDLEWQYDDEQRCVVCPWHGWYFDVKSGVNVDDEEYVVPTYDVEVDAGELFLVVG